MKIGNSYEREIGTVKIGIFDEDDVYFVEEGFIGKIRFSSLKKLKEKGPSKLYQALAENGKFKGLPPKEEFIKEWNKFLEGYDKNSSNY